MKKADLKRTILEAYQEVLLESLITDLYEDEEEETSTEEPEPEEEPEPDAPKETVLEDSTDRILNKFPTVKAAIIKLQTEDFKEFITTVDWVSPRPSSFRINLKNGQDYILKWTGTGFEAQIQGKRYYIDKITDYQQALDKLAVLYKEGPMKGAGEEDVASAEDIGSADTSGASEFPGDDGGSSSDDTGSDTPDSGGEDLSSEPVDFEAGEEPEA